MPLFTFNAAVGLISILYIGHLFQGFTTAASNDLCINAKPITLGIPISTNVTVATKDSNVTNDCLDGKPPKYPGVWFNLTGTGQRLVAQSCSQSLTYISIFTGGCNTSTLQCVAATYKSCEKEEPFNFKTIQGTTYSILVQTSYEGIMELSIFPQPPSPRPVPVPLVAVAPIPVPIPTKSPVQKPKKAPSPTPCRSRPRFFRSILCFFTSTFFPNPCCEKKKSPPRPTSTSNPELTPVPSPKPLPLTPPLPPPMSMPKTPPLPTPKPKPLPTPQPPIKPRPPTGAPMFPPTPKPTLPPSCKLCPGNTKCINDECCKDSVGGTCCDSAQLVPPNSINYDVDAPLECTDSSGYGNAIYCCAGQCFDGTSVSDENGICFGFWNFCTDTDIFLGENQIRFLLSVTGEAYGNNDEFCWAGFCRWTRNFFKWKNCNCPAGYKREKYSDRDCVASTCIGCADPNKSLIVIDGESFCEPKECQRRI
jgi:hypothetical protein